MAIPSTPSVLFLGPYNSVRSQMAEAFLRHLGAERFDAHSAGLKETDIHPYTICVMQEIGYDLRGQSPKSARRYLGKATFAYVIAVCEHTQEDCPRMFPGALRYLRWPFLDPRVPPASDSLRIGLFRKTRDAIQRRIEQWLSSPESAPAQSDALPPR